VERSLEEIRKGIGEVRGEVMNKDKGKEIKRKKMEIEVEEGVKGSEKEEGVDSLEG